MTTPPPVTDDVILDVRGLSTHFDLRHGALKAVDDLSFSLRRGKTTCVVGESGSGKSMTARSILNMVPHPGRIVAGAIDFYRERTDKTLTGEAGVVDLAALPSRSREIREIRGNHIAMIFQEPMSSLSPVHTIGAQIVEAIRLHQDVSKRTAKEMAIDLLRQVEVPKPDKAVDKYPFQYSGGMRQRAMIAMALSCRPSVLIADEPTTALDVTTQAEILDLIAALQAELGMAVMFITHDMGVVAEIADDVVVMRHGQRMEHGDVHTLFKQPKAPYTRDLLSSVQRLEAKAELRQQMDPPDTDAPILEVRDLAKHFEAREGFLQRVTDITKAVDGVDLSLSKGEALGIVGESGSGKTTLGRCIAGVYPVTDGNIRFRERDADWLDLTTLSDHKRRKLRRKIRMIFQDPFASLNPRMTVEQIIAEPLVVNSPAKRPEIKDRVAAILEDVGLSADMMERYPHAFSGGQRQRIVIGRAIALQPELIIADEPTSALDVSVRAQVLDLLLELQARLGLSFIFISHDMSVIQYFCHRIAVMYQGQLVEHGPTEQVINDPQHGYTQALLSAVPHADPARRMIGHRVRYRPDPTAH